VSDGLFRSIHISGTGLSGMRTKMDTVAKNLANAETTRTADGTPYRRERVVFEQTLAERLGERALPAPGLRAAGGLSRTHPGHLAGVTGAGGGALMPRGVETDVEVSPDASEFKVVYDPGHPDADQDGYVLMPNVNVITEMVDMITASRAYEANVSAVQTDKDMFGKALDI
jgi:flagellar basal-body rod protein FlgC